MQGKVGQETDRTAPETTPSNIWEIIASSTPENICTALNTEYKMNYSASWLKLIVENDFWPISKGLSLQKYL